MFRGRFLGIMLVLVLIFGVFGVVSSSSYRAGWSQGYAAGLVTDGSEEGVPPPAPYAGHGRYAPGWGVSPFLGFAGGVLRFFLFLLLIGLIFKFVGLLFWRKHRRKHWKGGWHWGRHHGHPPPWYDEEADEPIVKV